MTQHQPPSEKRSNQSPQKLKKSKNQLDQYVKYSGIAMQMAVIIFLGVFGGMKIDRWLKLEIPVFTLILSLSSVTLAIYIAIKDFLKSR
ncbi:MAG: AtpZ/AtpI family protein [Chlorobi bacterium]|nr:AtpZ/AtpI family protein [Chlorobiota bacterium]